MTAKKKTQLVEEEPDRREFVRQMIESDVQEKEEIAIPVIAQSLEPDASGFAPPPPKPVYFGDIDVVLQKLADNVPIVDTERIYLWELDAQRRIYMGLIGLGLTMVAFGLLYSIVP